MRINLVLFLFQQIMKTFNGIGSDYKIKETSAKKMSTPSSYAGTMYDKYGDAGIDALKEAWQEVTFQLFPLFVCVAIVS